MTIAISVAGASATAGTASTVALPTDADASKAASLSGVSCTTAGACTAVGSYTRASGGLVLPIVAVPGAGRHLDRNGDHKDSSASRWPSLPECDLVLTTRTVILSARAGANAFKLKLPDLAKGDYTATITAENANGTSRAIRLTFMITHA